ncbi:MAG: adenylate kinase [Oscillospiraceae bacterium]|nr:adenylate kinase [Oscillospiraceae bacterium]
MKLIFLGPPGAGKGTQASIASKKLGIPTISTGDMLRAAVKEGTEIGKQAKSFMDAGKLVPDSVIIGIVAERVEKADCAQGYILDGVPRTLAQARALEDAGIRFDHVVSIETTDQVVTQRLEGRRVCPDCGATFHTTSNPSKVEGVCDACGQALIQRHDDQAETIANRLKIYHKETEPLKEFYQQRGLLRQVEDTGSIESVNGRIMAVLGK